MTTAICFKCGDDKPGALVGCGHCGFAPKSKSECAVSLALSKHLSSEHDLSRYGSELRAGKTVTVPRDVLTKALGVLKDPQLLAMLRAHQPADAPSREDEESGSRLASDSTAFSSRVQPQAAPSPQTSSRGTTVLHESPFAALGATTRDNRARIVELANEKALELDPDVCQTARSNLTNPRTRLHAEVSWLPGVSPGRASKLIDQLRQDPMSMREDVGLPILTHLNLFAAALEAVDEEHDAHDLSALILENAALVEKLSAVDVMRDINEDRSISGFPPVQSVAQIDTELDERRQYYRNAIKQALDRLPPETLVRVVTEVVDVATWGGENEAPSLVSELVDSYEAEVGNFLAMESENIEKLLEVIRAEADSGKDVVKGYVDKLCPVILNWDKVAQPIQLVEKARGTKHLASHELAHKIHSLAVDLFNEQGMIAVAKQLVDLLANAFAEVPEVNEFVERDADTLAEIAAVEPIRELCDAALARVERDPRSGSEEGLTLVRKVKARLNFMYLNDKVSDTAYAEAGDILGNALVQCAVGYGNATSDWRSCVQLLEEASEQATDNELLDRISSNLATVKKNEAAFAGLMSIKKAPSLHTMNGWGFTLYGQADQRASDSSYLATYYFVVFMIPLIPIARYRVIPTGGGYRFLGRAGLELGDFVRVAVCVGVVVLGFAILGNM